MYVIEKWNGEHFEEYDRDIVAGFATLEEVEVWCHGQSPENPWGDKINLKSAFTVHYLRGEEIKYIPYPWKDASNES